MPSEDDRLTESVSESVGVGERLGDDVREALGDRDGLAVGVSPLRLGESEPESDIVAVTVTVSDTDVDTLPV